MPAGISVTQAAAINDGCTVTASKYKRAVGVVAAMIVIAVCSVPNLYGGMPEATPDTVLAVINQDTIYTSALDTLFLTFHKQLGNTDKKSFDYRTLFNKLVNDRLIIQEAKNLGMDEEPWLVERLDESRRHNAIRYFVSEHFKPNLEVSEDSVTAYFQTYYSKMQIRTVSVNDRSDAIRFIAAIELGSSMDSVAKAVSLDMYRYKGGLHNLKYWGDVEDALRIQTTGLRPGELSSPFPYRKVFAFLRVEQFIPADMAEFAQHRPRIESVLRALKREAQWTAFIDSLDSDISLTVDSLELARIKADSANLFTPEFISGAKNKALETEYGAVTDSALRSIISRNAMTAANVPFDSLFTMGLAAATEELLLSTAAIRAGYYDHPKVTGAYAQSLDSALIEAYVQETVLPQIVFNYAEFEAYYKEHLGDFTEPDQFQLDRLEISDEALAQEISQRLKDGTDFDFVGRQYGDGRVTLYRETEWVSLAGFPESIQKDIWQCDVGGSTSVFPATSGWIIFHVRGRRSGEVQSLADVEMKIREVMFQRKFNEILDRTLDTLKANSDIELNDPAIDKYFGEKS